MARLTPVPVSTVVPPGPVPTKVYASPTSFGGVSSPTAEPSPTATCVSRDVGGIHVPCGQQVEGQATSTPGGAGSFPVGASPAETGTVTTCTVDAPCYYSVVLPTLNEDAGGSIAATLMVFVIVVMFVKPAMRLVLALFLVLAVLGFVLTVQDVWLYTWVILALMVGGLSNVLRIWGHE